jgi:hypothetical protein
MKSTKRSLGLLIASGTLLFVIGVSLPGGLRVGAVAQTVAADRESAQAKIALAMSAGPIGVAKSARIVDTNAQGEIVVLRDGNNGFTCMPGNPKVVGDPPMCSDAAAMQWAADIKAHKAKPTNTVPGITYMLAGATQRSDTDPNDTTSPPVPIGPHWMIIWPFDPKTTGLPTVHKPAGAYIMWAGSPYAHLHIMGPP